MRKLKFIIGTCLLVALLMPSQALAKKKEKVDIYDLSLDENIEYPAITGEKQIEIIKAYQLKVALELKKKNYDVELMRNDEIIIVTIQAANLFNHNDTVLTDVGKRLLTPLTKYLANPGFYKMLLVMHSDNTGSRTYTLNLTRDRVNAIFDWMERTTSIDYVVPYALGESDPVTDNNSMDHRKQNRRLEIYIVPDEVMLNQAKKGSVNINNLK